ncbi:pyrroline-5-carboxylate reductase, partial [Xanthomonas oryzae pv. oryzae]
NLFGTDVLPQQNLDLADTLSVDAWTPAGLCAPMLADALRVIGPILHSVLVATQFAADRAGRTSELKPPVDRRL